MEFNKLYSFILSPPANVMNDFKGFKAFCRQMIGDNRSLFSKAHITICKEHPERPSIMRRKAIRLTDRLKNIPSVKLTVSGFSYFSNGANGFTIYARVGMNQQLSHWFDELKRCCDNAETIIPHITIARGLTARQFNLLWPYFTDRPYHQTFMADNVLILEKDMLEAQPSQKFADITLGHKNVTLPQAWDLFSSPVHAA
jgi:2'-5' RNA ligase